MALLILLAIIVAAALWAVSVYNSLVRRRNVVAEAWSGIDAQLKRRADLIPNLVETVKGYAKHESGTLEKVIQARNAAVNAGSVGERAAAEGQLSGALRQVFALSEAYPDLKANENFKALQEELTATENRIGFARQHYNDVVGQYNTASMRFPGNLVAGLFGFRRVEFFQLDAAQAAAVREAPKVKF